MARSLAPLLLLGLGASFAILPACSAPDGSSGDPADAPGDEAALGSPTSISFQDGVSPTTSYAGATDTNIEEATPTTPDGSDPTLHADFDFPDGTKQSIEGLLRFDVSAIPAGSAITSASLTLDVTNRTTGTGYSLYPLTRAWTDSQATWNAAKTGTNWAAPGARGSSDRSATAVGTLTPTAVGKSTVTLNAAGLAAVQAWVADPTKNFGLVLDTANDPDGLVVESSDATTAANRPKLTIAYTPPSAPAAVSGTGLEGDYYTGTAFQTLVTSRTDKTIDFTWSGSPATGVPADGFSVRWTGQILPLYSQTYTFSTQSDDGIRLWVNGTEIVNNWTDHGSTENTGTIALTAGKKVDVKIEYYENTGSAVADLSWSSPSQPKQIVPTAQLFPASATPPPVTTTGFVHPGILLGTSQLDFVKAKIAAGAEPWTTAFNHVKATHYGKLGVTPSAAATLSRNGTASSAVAIDEDDITAYTDALLWNYTGNAAYADQAIAILNAWATTLTSVDSTAQLDAAWASEVMPRAAEIIRYTYTPASGHAALNVAALKTMLTNVILPQLSPTSDGATYSNGNWELSMAEGTMNIGIFTDSKTIYDGGVAMWRARVPAYIYEPSDGAVPVFPPGGKYDSAAYVTCLWATGGQHETSCTKPAGFGFLKGMAQESCRDISHVILAFEGMTNAAETARLQGLDLYGEQRQRMIDGYEFAAQHDIEALDHPLSGGTSGTVDANTCGGVMSYGGLGYEIGWEIAFNEFVTRGGASMPYTQQMIARLRPTPGALQAEWETLTHAGAP